MDSAPASHAARRRRRALAARNDSAFSSDDCVVPSKFAAATTVNEIETPSTTFSETTYAETPMPASSPESVEYLSTFPESCFAETPVPPPPADLESPPAASPPTVRNDGSSFLARSDADGFPLRRVGFSSDSTCTQTPKARFVPEADSTVAYPDIVPSRFDFDSTNAGDDELHICGLFHHGTSSSFLKRGKKGGQPCW